MRTSNVAVRLPLALLLGGMAIVAAWQVPAGAGVQPAGHPAPSGPPLGVEARTADVATIEGLTSAYFESISGAAGEARDWDRLRSLCHPDARFVASRPMGGGAGVFALTVEDFVTHNRRYFEKGGFFEREVSRREERFGNIAHVWSTYESRRNAEDPQPYVRGIYSFQLHRDADRWWIISVFWDYERPENPIPQRYLDEGRRP